jgi:hypothetical protein
MSSGIVSPAFANSVFTSAYQSSNEVFVNMRLVLWL